MSAVPEPSDGIRAARMAATAELVTRAADLTEHGKDLLIGTLIQYTDPIVRQALVAALGGAEAGQGLTEEPRPAETAPGRPALWVIWQQHKTGEWTEACAGTEDDARYYRSRTAPDGSPYLVLPEGQRPDEAGA